MQCATPIRAFFVCFLPSASLALIATRLAAQADPSNAQLFHLTLVFFAFALSVAIAARCTTDQASRRGRVASVLELLDLRRNRHRYAFIFAVTAASIAEAALHVCSLLGVHLVSPATITEFAVILLMLFAAAWVQIGQSVGGTAFHEALRRMGDRT
jgi:hypothetical protein